MNHHLGLYLFFIICETVNGEEVLFFAFLSLRIEIKLEADDTCVPTQCCVRSSALVLYTPDSPMVTNAEWHHALFLGSLVQSVVLNLLENIGAVAYDHRQCLMATTFTTNAIPGFN